MVNYKDVPMAVGKMRVYDFGDIKLHAYQTNDPIDDEVFVIEKNKRAVVIELPCFKNNIEELTKYIDSNGIRVEGKMIAYHAAGSSFIPNVKNYGTKTSIDYNSVGGGKALIENFTGAFGDAFDCGIPSIDEIMTPGKVNIAGIEMNIVSTPDAYNIEIESIKSVYIHMMGHDCHSIVAGTNHADAMINELQNYIDRDFSLILTSHYTPENLKDAEEKIAYLKNIKGIASKCSSAEQFKEKIRETYPQYSGGNYLDMTAGFFLPE